MRDDDLCSETGFYITGPKLGNMQELDQKQTEERGAGMREGTPLKKVRTPCDERLGQT